MEKWEIMKDFPVGQLVMYFPAKEKLVGRIQRHNNKTVSIDIEGQVVEQEGGIVTWERDPGRGWRIGYGSFARGTVVKLEEPTGLVMCKKMEE